MSGSPVEKITGFFMISQEFVNFSPQLGILCTFCVKEGGALICREPERLVKNDPSAFVGI